MAHTECNNLFKNQRRKDFFAVKDIFVPAFNILIRTMNDNKHF